MPQTASAALVPPLLTLLDNVIDDLADDACDEKAQLNIQALADLVLLCGVSYSSLRAHFGSWAIDQILARMPQDQGQRWIDGADR